MAKKVFYDDDARRRILGGAQILYDAVKTTMGPKGRNVVIGKGYGGPTVTHDGVAVAKGIELDDVDDETLGYKVGAELIKQAANKMNDVAGDGTTTVTVLTYHILSEANKLIAAGHSPMLLRKGLEAAAQDVIAKLGGMSEGIAGKKNRVAEVATISAGDPEIGELIADVMEKVGKDGVVTVEEGQGLALESEVVEGFTMDRGYVSPYMVTDTTRMEAVYEKPAILITDKKISSVQDFLPMLEKLANAGKKDVVIIAEDVDGEALGTLVLNRLKGVFNSVAVKAPAFGDRRKEVLEDIAILTGGDVITEDRGYTFENAELEMVGSARKVIVTKDDTTIIEGGGSKAAVKARIEQINKQVEASTSEYDREQLEKRRAALSGKVAVIKVGGATETEIEEKKFRVDDAVHAVKAALDEGVVAGGGVTLINLAGGISAGDQDKSVSAGADIMVSALEQPFRILLTNSGINADAWLPQVQKAKTGQGIDVNKPSKLIDLKAAGIIDPVRVVKEAVQNSVSIAGTAMTMGALVVDVPEPKTSAMPPAPGGMGMDY
ncbi:chaperonin GroL [Candidatus Saccharibacteria bacterium RIFCSPLOWO2_01_FULL_48_13]|nr:MAG: chaperonin GroL [Candidatus Saccharibacteria bacterium RIFCSPHIGHO2_01_FULL_48_12]OGL36793.1 MAG: chaperonin GroL [Candidatus Saccharibacteria bacterium RIFCSPHIGHO2_12_FULL_48_21]OGL37372.1 MAG: chaperonin GroL [Candidatus Saccharibacteria bacterium RIFCSPLOWO2_01_FULL_48_13]